METKPRVGLIIAMRGELDAFLDTLNGAVTMPYKGKTFYLAEYAGIPLVLALCGVGKVNAAYTATLMLERFQPEFLLNTGVAGGFGLDVYDVFVAEKVVQHDIDTTAFGDPRGYISGLGEVFIDADLAFVDACAKYVPGAKKGVIASGDQFIASHAKAADIVSAFGASACDMESGAVGQVAYIAGARFGILRTITDNGNDSAKESFSDTLQKAAKVNKEAVLTILPFLC